MSSNLSKPLELIVHDFQESTVFMMKESQFPDTLEENSSSLESSSISRVFQEPEVYPMV